MSAPIPAISAPGSPPRRAEVLALLLEGRAAACSRREAAEPAQRVRALCDAPVVLRDPLVLVPAGAVGHARPERLADGPGVRVVPVGRHLLGRVTGHVAGLGEEAPGGGHVALLAQQRVDAVALPVDRPVAVAPGTIDPDSGLVRVLFRAALPAPLGPQTVGQERGAAGLPVPDRLMAEGEAARQEQRGQVPQAALVAQPPQHDEQHAVGGILPMVVGRAGALVADPPAVAAAEGALAQRGTPGLLHCRGRDTLRARHRRLLHVLATAATLPARSRCDQPLSDS